MVRIAAAQFEVKLGQPEANIAAARRLVANAKSNGAELVVLPELWSSGYALDEASRFGSSLHAGVFAEVGSLASEQSVFLCGSLVESSEGKFFNTQVLYAPDGNLLAAYRKIHLFGGMREGEFLAAGERLVLASLPWAIAGLAICYDLRFPQMFRSYSSMGAQLLLVSSEWPEARLDHWRTLVMARAIENQAYVVACNCIGESRQDRFGGHSMIVDPWGKILAEAGGEEELITADLNFDLVTRLRKQFPVLADQRPEIYEASLSSSVV